jgi:hypothetical protein
LYLLQQDISKVFYRSSHLQFFYTIHIKMAYGIIPFACLVGTAFANGPADLFGFSPVAVKGDSPLAKRQNARCTSSVISELQPAEPTNSDFASWASSAGTDRLNDPGCSVTVPASFSDDFLDYYSTVKEYYETIESAAAEVTTDCGYDRFGLSLSLVCDESQTIYWSGATETGSAAPTATNDDDDDDNDDDDDLPSTVIEALEIPAETIWFGEGNSGGDIGDNDNDYDGSDDGDDYEDSNGAADNAAVSGKKTMLASAMTLAGFLGVALAL